MFILLSSLIWILENAYYHGSKWRL